MSPALARTTATPTIGFDAEQRTFRMTFNVPLNQATGDGDHRLRMRPVPGQNQR